MKLADTNGEIGPADPFKIGRIRKVSNVEIPLKPNNLSYWEPNDKIGSP